MSMVWKSIWTWFKHSPSPTILTCFHFHVSVAAAELFQWFGLAIIGPLNIYCDQFQCVGWAEPYFLRLSVLVRVFIFFHVILPCVLWNDYSKWDRIRPWPPLTTKRRIILTEITWRMHNRAICVHGRNLCQHHYIYKSNKFVTYTEFSIKRWITILHQTLIQW